METKRKNFRGKRRWREQPVTLAEVDGFLTSPVAGHYYSFSESNVKRRLIRMLFFLRKEVDWRDRRIEALERELYATCGQDGAAAEVESSARWTQRVGK